MEKIELACQQVSSVLQKEGQDISENIRSETNPCIRCSWIGYKCAIAIMIFIPVLILLITCILLVTLYFGARDAGMKEMLMLLPGLRCNSTYAQQSGVSPHIL